MSTAKDRTEDFKDAVRGRAVSMGYHESKVASVLASVSIHKPWQRLPFTKASLKALESVAELEQFLKTRRKDYVDVDRSYEQEQDRFEQKVVAFIETCKEQINILNSHFIEDGVSSKGSLAIRGESNVDARGHKKGVVLILSERLDSVSSQFDSFRTKGFPDANNKPVHRGKLATLSRNKSEYISQIQPKRTQSDTDADRVQQQFLDDETRSHQVPHYKQQSSWDCGLACILMILRTLGISTCNIEDLKNLCNINRCPDTGQIHR